MKIKLFAKKHTEQNKEQTIVQATENGKTDDPLITIVVPVYNTEDYLDKCIDSIIEQTYTNLEIIFVNDGSTDNSEEIIRHYADIDERIVLINQENAGVSLARNNAIKRANGKYIIFWDSDDWFHKDAISAMVAKAEKTQADVCLCNAQALSDKTGKHKPAEFIRKDYPDKDPFSWEDCPDKIFLSSTVPWNKLVRLDFLRNENISFPELTAYTDFFYSALLVRLAKRVTVVRRRLIYYRLEREGSITFNADNKGERRLKSHMQCYQELQRRQLLNDQRLRNCFFEKIALDCRFFIRFFNDYSSYERFYEMITSDISALSCYDRNTDDVPSVNDFLDYDAKEYLFMEFKKQYNDAMRYRQLGIDRGKTIRKLEKQIQK